MPDEFVVGLRTGGDAAGKAATGFVANGLVEARLVLLLDD